ncbi:13137_t:CDS:2, partial [Ambispora leptoticha]
MGDPQTYFEEHATWSLISFLQYRRQYAKDFTRDKLNEHRTYTKGLERIISNNESKEKCAQAQKCLNEFNVRVAYVNIYQLTEIEAPSSWLTTSRPVTVNHAFPRGIDYASISMLQLGTTSFWLLIYSLLCKDEKSSHEVDAFWMSDSIKLTKLSYAKSALDKTIEETKEIRSIVSDETIFTLRDDNAFLYVNTPESKRVLDRDCESDEKPRKRTKTEDDDYYDDESESDESDDECGLRLNVEEMGFDEYVDRNDIPSYRSKVLAHAQNSDLIMTKNYHEILSLSHILLLQMDNYSEMQVKTFSRETLEDLRKDIKSKLIGKEKVTRDIKSILQEYIVVALDDNDGGLHKLRETITESFSKKFNSTAEKEFLRRMKFLFEHL